MMSSVQSLVAQVSLLCCVITNVICFETPSKADYASGEVTLTLIEDRLNWDAANYACASVLGGTLARIDSLSMFRAIENFTRTTWDGQSYGDSWISLRWRVVVGSAGQRRLVWSDNCQVLDENRFTQFKDGDGTNDGTEFCYRHVLRMSFIWKD
ncbi:hypothetical protein PoB_006400100 [Plakobranchus ocellatus]|uniref:C-type lectin domain-containing protein n=1 Tax=Plakobranchus ocellatus TaxID=259542 RepID=A0AAV4CZV8_9GAST|nr:hypothetical protein PoB_006400100 [Plakobranchus ocellatus]